MADEASSEKFFLPLPQRPRLLSCLASLYDSRSPCSTIFKLYSFYSSIHSSAVCRPCFSHSVCMIRGSAPKPKSNDVLSSSVVSLHVADTVLSDSRHPERRSWAMSLVWSRSSEVSSRCRAADNGIFDEQENSLHSAYWSGRELA